MTQTEPTPGAEPSRREALEQRVETALEHVKPKLRGWLHAGMTPVALVAGIILIVLAGTTTEKVSAAVFAGTAVLLFGTSAVYHRGTWSPRVGGFLRRFDHSNIFLIIAGTYTPFALLLPPDAGPRMLHHRLERRLPRRALPGVLGRRPALALRAGLRRCSAGSRSSTSARCCSTPAPP